MNHMKVMHHMNDGRHDAGNQTDRRNKTKTEVILLSLSLSHTHTHTRARARARECARTIENGWHWLMMRLDCEILHRLVN